MPSLFCGLVAGFSYLFLSAFAQAHDDFREPFGAVLFGLVFGTICVGVVAMSGLVIVILVFVGFKLERESYQRR